MLSRYIFFCRFNIWNEIPIESFRFPNWIIKQIFFYIRNRVNWIVRVRSEITAQHIESDSESGKTHIKFKTKIVGPYRLDESELSQLYKTKKNVVYEQHHKVNRTAKLRQLRPNNKVELKIEKKKSFQPSTERHRVNLNFSFN